MTRQTSSSRQQVQAVDDFWTYDTHLFDGIFRYYSRGKDKLQPVRGKLHVSTEQYSDKYDEIVLLSNPHKGERAYVMLHPYVFEPKITLTIGVYKQPKHYADQDSVIGETIGAPKQEGVQERQIGNGQAWYYPDDKTLVLWECFLEDFVRDTPLLNDHNMKQLWSRFEDWLLKQFPQTVTIATPFSDPLFSTADYQKFLRSLGYTPGAKAAFTKLVK